MKIIVVSLVIISFLYISGCKDKNKISIPELVEIPAGKFVIGSSSGFLDTFPPKTIYLSKYKIGKYEVSVKQFCEFLNEVKDPDEKYIDLNANSLISEFNNNYFIYKVKKGSKITKDYSNYAVHSVSFIGASEYCKWLSKKTGKKFMLPTEAQWEKAAVWSDKKRTKFGFPWGNEDKTKEYKCFTNKKEYPNRGIKKIDSDPETVSEYGCYHMADNVSEWCRDHYQKNYYSFIETKDPVCEKKSEYRSIRGGSWLSERNQCLGIYRGYDFPNIRLVNYGFRVVCTD